MITATRSCRVVRGINDLKTCNPKLAEQLVSHDPSSIAKGSNTMASWRCDRGHEWDAMVSSRSKMGIGCPFCSGRRLLPGFNDLKTTHPEVAKQAEGWDPVGVSGGSGKRATWRCDLNHVWGSIISNRTKNGAGCPYCAGQRVWPGFNDLASAHPDISTEAHGWNPTQVTAQSGRKMEWKCSLCDNIWTSTVISRSGKGTGCPRCAKTGYDTSRDGYLYLLHHSRWGLLKIGISNFPNDRVRRHLSRGWRQLDILGPVPGSEARAIEQKVLKYIRRNASTPASVIAGIFDGHTESWVARELPVQSLSELYSFVASKGEN